MDKHCGWRNFWIGDGCDVFEVCKAEDILELPLEQLLEVEVETPSIVDIIVCYLGRGLWNYQSEECEYRPPLWRR